MTVTMSRFPRPAVRLMAAAALAVGLLGLAAGGSVATEHRRPIELTFPTEPSASFGDDYDVGRGDGAHRATDLLAPHGAPVYAARGGRVTWVTRHRTAGWAVHVRGEDGRTYAYYHLGPADGERSQALVDAVAEGVTVERGQLIGYVGDSGNAAGGPPHLHFEIHDDRVTDPYGGNRLNPVTSLRAALARGDYVTAAASGVELAPVLRPGAQGMRVTAWQHELNAHRGAPILTDGVFGSQTSRATRELQRAEGLGVDGVVGPRTRAVSAAALPADSPLFELLTLGDRGPRVAEWQQQLDVALPRPVAVDGVFGPQTGRATRDLQRSRGLLVDGVVGPRARQAMSDTLRER